MVEELVPVVLVLLSTDEGFWMGCDLEVSALSRVAVPVPVFVVDVS